MAIIGERNFQTSNRDEVNIVELIDSSDKLLKFIRANNISSVPLNIKELLEKLDIKLEESDMDNDISGKLVKDGDSDNWKILVNAKHHINRRRYTIIHEVAHFCLHKHRRDIFEDKIFFRGEDSSREEWQANSFASEVLMPEDDFRNQVTFGTTSVGELAKRYGVSTLAIRIRAKNLHMAGHGL